MDYEIDFLEIWGPTIVISLLIITVICMLVFIPKPVELDDQFLKGEITLTTYCMNKTNGGTSDTLPIACYDFFKVHPQGAREECHLVGKTRQCTTKTILRSNE